MGTGRTAPPEPAPPEPARRPESAVVVVMASGAPRLLRRTWAAIAIAGASAALAGAALAAGVVPPADVPLAAIGTAAALAAQGAVLLAVCLAWLGGGAAARPYEGLIPHLRVRGAGTAQIARLVLGLLLPVFAVGVVASAVEARVAAGAVGAAVAQFSPTPGTPSPQAAGAAPGPAPTTPPSAPLHTLVPQYAAFVAPTFPPQVAAVHTVTAGVVGRILLRAVSAGAAPARLRPLLWRSLHWALLAALCTALAAAGGFTAVLLRRPEHHRRAVAGRPTWMRHLWPDAFLLVGAAALAAALAGARGGPGASISAAFGGLPFAGAVADSAHIPPQAAYVGAAFALAGASLLAGRILSFAVRAVERARGDRLSAVGVLTARAIARGAAPLRLVLLPALTFAALFFAISGTLAAARTDRLLRGLEVGAPLRISEVWPAGCAGGCLNPIILPVPPIAAWNAAAPGVAQAATLVGVDASIRTSAGSVGATLFGVTPDALRRTADWTFLPQGPADLGALAAARPPGGAVVSTALARQASVGRGDLLITGALPPLRIVAVVPGWPGLGLGDNPWALVPQSAVQSYLGTSLRSSLAGESSILLARLRPGAATSGVTGAISRHGGVITGLAVAGSSGWGLGPLPFIVVPECVALLLLGGMALRAPPLDGAAFPAGDALAAVSGAAEVARARKRVRRLVAWWGPTWGALAGTCLAPAFWDALRLAAPSASSAPFQPVWWGLGGAAGLCATGLWRLGAGLRAEPPPAVDALIEGRVLAGFAATWDEALGAGQGEPAGAEAGRARRRARRGGGAASGAVAGADDAAQALQRRAGLAALQRARTDTTLAPVLALRRLAATWRRLPGLAAGMLVSCAVAAVIPLFTAGALTRVLETGLPSVDGRPAGAVLLSDYPPGGVSVDAADLGRLAALASGLGAAAGTTQSPPVNVMISGAFIADPGPGPGSPTTAPYLQLAALSGLASHARFQQGVPPAAAPEADGTIDVAATALAVELLHLRLGHVYTAHGPSGTPIRLRLTGVFTEVAGDGSFWPYLYFNQDVFAAPAVWHRVVLTQHLLPVGNATWYTVLHLNRLTAQKVPAAVAGLTRLNTRAGDAAPGTSLAGGPVGSLRAFLARERTLTALLRLAGIPVLALTLYFVAITASLVVAAEAPEIALLLGRGARPGQVATIYLAEWVLLALPLLALAPLPAVAMARAMGAAGGFLQFARRGVLPVFLQPVDFAYAGGAALLAVLAALVPVLGAVGRSAVEARAQSGRAPAPPFWQRANLDAAAVALLVITWLFLRGAKVHGAGAAAVAGDPALFTLPGVLLAAAGFLGTRLLGWIFRLADRLWGARLPLPVSLSLRRIGRLPGQFAPVLLLLCFTAGLGTYSAAAARTLTQNLATTVQYQVGAPMRLVEASSCTIPLILPPVCAEEGVGGSPPRALPPFRVNLSLPGVRSATQMVEEPLSIMGVGGRPLPATLVLVDASNFAQTAWWPEDLNPLPESGYLRLLGSRPGAVLVSPGLPGAGGGALTATISGGAPIRLRPVGSLTRWPGADVVGPMVVAPLSAESSVFGLTCGDPHLLCLSQRVVLLSLKSGASPAALEAALGPLALIAERSDVAQTEEAAAIATPEWAGQTGMLTIGFLIALAVTAVGYLLYAAVVLRGQTAQIGLLRAVGMGRRPLVASAAVEQGALVLTGGVVGVAAGRIASRLFLPLYSPAFTGPDSAPFLVLGPGRALGEVAGLCVGLLAVVLALLLLLLRRMHVGETVKLEE